MDDFSLLDLFFSMMYIYLVIAWIAFMIHLIGDVFRSRDLSGAQKAVWMIFLVFMPFIAAVTYLIVRGDKMYDRQPDGTAARRDPFHDTRHLATSTADEITKLAVLRDNGTITVAEFEAQKRLALAR